MPSTSYCDITSLRVALVEHAAEIAVTVLGEPNLRLCSSGRELRFGNRGSLAIAINGPKAGQWYDHETGEGGDLIDLIRRQRCCSFRDATTYAEELIGTAPRRCRRSLGRAQKPTRAGVPCQRPPIRGPESVCRLHGGLSPGAPRGLKNGNYKTGDWTSEAITERKWLRSLVHSFAKSGTTE